MKAQITREFTCLSLVRASVWNSLQYLICLKSERVKLYSVLKSVKLLLALSMWGVPEIRGKVS